MSDTTTDTRILTVTIPWRVDRALSPNARNTKEFGIMEVTEYRNAPGEIGVSRGPTWKVSAPMPPKYIHPRFWTPEEVETVREWYKCHPSGVPLCLDELASMLGRHKSNVSRKARSLGLTDHCRKSTPTSLPSANAVAPRWTPQEDQFIREHYLDMTVGEMADRMNRSLSAVYARKHKLECTQPNEPRRETRHCQECHRPFEAVPSSPKKYCSIACAYASPDRVSSQPRKRRGLRECPVCHRMWHPTTKSSRRRYCSKTCGNRSRERWVDFTCVQCGKKFRSRPYGERRTCSKACNSQRRSDVMVERHRGNPAGTPRYSNRKNGRREDLGNQYFRSAWEANVARYLEFLKANGEIHAWEYEADTFWFEAIKRGVRSYTPDFKIWDAPDSEPYYWEVKGYDYPRGRTARKRMAKYYPDVRLDLIGEDEYKAIAKWKGLIPEWE